MITSEKCWFRSMATTSSGCRCVGTEKSLDPSGGIALIAAHATSQLSHCQQLLHAVSIVIMESVAWAAGLFEGEGCLTTREQRPRNTENKYPKRPPYPTLTLVSTDKDVVERFHRAVGVGLIHGPYWYNNSTKEVWRWNGTGWGSLRTIWTLFEPFLGARRSKKFREVMSNDPGAHSTPTCAEPSARAYRRHLQDNEPPCQGCRKANADRIMTWKIKSGRRSATAT